MNFTVCSFLCFAFASEGDDGFCHAEVSDVN